MKKEGPGTPQYSQFLSKDEPISSMSAFEVPRSLLRHNSEPALIQRDNLKEMGEPQYDMGSLGYQFEALGEQRGLNYHPQRWEPPHYSELNQGGRHIQNFEEGGGWLYYQEQKDPPHQLELLHRPKPDPYKLQDLALLHDNREDIIENFQNAHHFVKEEDHCFDDALLFMDEQLQGSKSSQDQNGFTPPSLPVKKRPSRSKKLSIKPTQEEMKVYMREAILMTANGAVAQLILENHEPFMTLAQIQEGIAPIYHQLRRLDGSKYTGKLTFFLKSTLNSNGIFTVRTEGWQKNEYGQYGVDKEAAREYFEDQERKIKQNPKLQIRVKNRSISLYTKNSASLRTPHVHKLQSNQLDERVYEHRLIPLPQDVEEPLLKIEAKEEPNEEEIKEETKEEENQFNSSEKGGTFGETKKSEVDSKEEMLNEIEGKLGDRLIADQKKQIQRVRKVLLYKQIYLKLEYIYQKVLESKRTAEDESRGYEELGWEEYPLRELLKSSDLVKEMCESKKSFETEVAALETYKFFRPLLKLAINRFSDEERACKSEQILNKIQAIESEIDESEEDETEQMLKPRKNSELSEKKGRTMNYNVDSIIEGHISSKASPERPYKKQII